MKDVDSISNFLFTVIRMSTPIAYGALGLCMTKNAGLLNMATESMMLCAALCGVVVSGYTQSLILGIIGGMLGGMLIGFLIAYAAFICKTDLWMTCIAINTAVSGGTILAMYVLTGQKTYTLGYIDSLSTPNIDIPIIKDIPFIGNVISGHNLFVYLVPVFLLIEWFLLYRTKLGLRIRAVGQNPLAAESVGIAPVKIYFLAFLLAGFFSSLSGMYMSMGYLHWFAKDMMGGRGFISMSASTIAGGSPIASAGVSFVFGLSDAIANYLQLGSAPAEIAYMVPYIATILLTAILMINTRRKEKLIMKKRIEEVQKNYS